MLTRQNRARRAQLQHYMAGDRRALIWHIANNSGYTVQLLYKKTHRSNLMAARAS